MSEKEEYNKELRKLADASDGECHIADEAEKKAAQEDKLTMINLICATLMRHVISRDSRDYAFQNMLEAVRATSSMFNRLAVDMEDPLTPQLLEVLLKQADNLGSDLYPAFKEVMGPQNQSSTSVH